MELLDLKKNTFYRLVNDYEKSLEITKEAVWKLKVSKLKTLSA
jgi:hypothetical protein